MLSNDAWLNRGKLARAYVEYTYGCDVAVAKHIEVYRDLLATQQGGKRLEGWSRSNGES